MPKTWLEAVRLGGTEILRCPHAESCTGTVQIAFFDMVDVVSKNMK